MFIAVHISKQERNDLKAAIINCQPGCLFSLQPSTPHRSLLCGISAVVGQMVVKHSRLPGGTKTIWTNFHFQHRVRTWWKKKNFFSFAQQDFVAGGNEQLFCSCLWRAVRFWKKEVHFQFLFLFNELTGKVAEYIIKIFVLSMRRWKKQFGKRQMKMVKRSLW